MDSVEKNERLNLPIGLRSFSALRKAGGLYIDKTPIIKRLLAGSRHYYISRPDGFGKTLLTTTLCSFFSGEQSAFKNLSLEKEALRIESDSFRVVSIDFDEGSEHIDAAIEDIKRNASENQPTVLLVDNINPAEESTLNLLREQLRLQNKLDFVLITGHYPFSTIAANPSDFGLIDISTNLNVAAICGFTASEIKRILRMPISESAQYERLSNWVKWQKLRESARSFRFSAGSRPVYSPEDIFTALTTTGRDCAEAFADSDTTSLPRPDSMLLEAMKIDLEEGRPDDFMVKLRSIFSSVAYGAVQSIEAERHFQTYLFLIVRLMGFSDSELERLTSGGRIDMRIATQRFIYIFEFKTHGTAASALSQIRSHGYLHADQSDSREIWLIGANFSKTRRSIGDWKIAPGKKTR